MALAYENATSGDNAIKDMQKLLQGFGCNKFGQMMDWERGELLVQFEHRGRQVTARASVNGYAKAWLKAHPYTSRTRGSQINHECRAKKIGGIAVYSILRDWIKGQITAIETGVLSFDGAFLGQIMLPSGRTMLEHVERERLLSLPPPT